MTDEDYPPCEACGFDLRHPKEWLVCPEEGHDHDFCLMCAVKWDLGDLSSGKGQTLRACPDTLQVARELMKPEPEMGEARDDGHTHSFPFAGNQIPVTSNWLPAGDELPATGCRNDRFYRKSDGTVFTHDGGKWVEMAVAP